MGDKARISCDVARLELFDTSQAVYHMLQTKKWITPLKRAFLWFEHAVSIGVPPVVARRDGDAQ